MKKIIALFLIGILSISLLFSFTSCKKDENEHSFVEINVEDYGTMKVELYPEYAPDTVANFLMLVDSGFYNGLTFHRVMENFMIQGGDPNGDGTGGSPDTIYGEFSENGFSKNTLSHERGVISMARNSYSMDSASSQFFIMHKDYTGLDGSYAAFGKLVDGYDVLDAIATSPVSGRLTGSFSIEYSKPVETITISSMRIVPN